MSKILKAKVINGRYKGEIVRVTNVSVDELGRKNAACFLPNGGRANIAAVDLEVIPEEAPKESETKFAKTASMPFVSGSIGSRTMAQTKNMSKNRVEVKKDLPVEKYTAGICETCGNEYNIEERRGKPGKLTQCENCAPELS